jgi:hypothetical protein
MPMREHLLLIFWCPDPGSQKPPKDSLRILEDTRYAVAKASVARILLEVFPAPKPQTAQVEAQSPQDIVSGAETAGKTADRAATGVVGYQTPLSEEDCTALHQPVPAAPVTSTMNIDARPYPFWRGGSKSHTFTSSSGSSRTPGTSTRRGSFR